MSATTDEIAGRIFDAALGTADLLSVYLGDRLGYYRALVEIGPAGPGELAAATGTAERYAREWLEQQATTGLLEHEGRGADARYTIGTGAAEVLTDTSSLDYLAPLARMLAAAAVQLPALLEAYRTGGGVSWDQLGPDARESQADMNRPWFERRLAPSLASVPELHDLLGRAGARIADVGCGAGWSTLALARAYPGATVVGIDVDEPSVEAARASAVRFGLDDRVEFRHADGGGVDDEFDVAFVFEALHDMPRPVEVLSALRRAVRDDGAVVIVDEAVADELTPGDGVERIMYGFSLLVCLPDGMSSPHSVGTGTVMRRAVLERYAREAGFTAVEQLPIEGFGLLRFSRLRP
ncbi:class I SAM-dependent methyltransferase [Protaetiibacter mangrovi]|uniref:Class I SAM-dependent methyltransferase n=1 Tax=Protaetiibacter mangrovi TaxID=2970926 RepID=A0ABT1ZBQ7_9MICO|nr:class I SAM-dependent methyltransferase [Protaetiibacter mangrovi]MCS0498134.1 class I SAM-dependent methyltransferase [Protaetiibacter mangrovi]TPX03723.1 class I SAM-dependent methyltransferase [Schumannella luteola]